jgi:allophanate hydrolase
MPDANDLIPIVVVGAHLSGLPLNHQLTTPGGHLVRKGKTAADYRLFELHNTVPPKPGLVRDPTFSGPGLDVEVWELPPMAFGHFVAQIPAPLGIGKVTLDDGSSVSGFLCEAHAVEGARDITAFGGWRAFLASNGSTSP